MTVKNHVFILIALLTSCNQRGEKIESDMPITDSKAKKVDSVSNDSIPKIQKEVTISLKPFDKNTEVSAKLKIFKDAYLANYNSFDSDENILHILNRFPSDKKFIMHLRKKFSLDNVSNTKNLYPEINLRAFVYSDSSQCANALNNWFNCFGTDCEQIEPGKEKVVKSTPGYYIINEREIICLDYKIEFEKNNWNEIINNLNYLFKHANSKIIKVAPRGKLLWINK